MITTSVSSLKQEVLVRKAELTSYHHLEKFRKVKRRLQSSCPTNLPVSFLLEPFLAEWCAHNWQKSSQNNWPVTTEKLTNYHKTWGCKPHGKAVLEFLYPAAVRPGMCSTSIAQLCLTFLWPHGLLFIRFLCPWDSPDKNILVGYQFLLQGIFSIQRLNPCLLHCQAGSLPLRHLGRPWTSLPNKVSYVVSIYVSNSSFLSVRKEPTLGSWKGSPFLQQNGCAL